jgi:hypothetical protein
MDIEPRRLAKKLSLYKDQIRKQFDERNSSDVSRYILPTVAEAFEKATEERHHSAYGGALVKFALNHYGRQPRAPVNTVARTPNRSERRATAKKAGRKRKS